MDTEDDGRPHLERMAAGDLFLAFDEEVRAAYLRAQERVRAVNGTVVEDVDGRYRGVEAVIDKDFASARLARSLGADLLWITTGVDRVAVNFGRPDERSLDVLDAIEARRHLDDGQFPAGSMGLKIEAALDYLDDGGSEVLISSADRLADALAGRTGTRIVASRASAPA